MPSLLSTQGLAGRQSCQYWQELVCDTFVELDCAPLQVRDFSGSIATARAGDIALSVVDTTAQRVDRTPTRIARARTELVLASVQLRGEGRVIQQGRCAHLRPGDFAIYDSTQPYTLAFDADFAQLVLHLPREHFARHIGDTRGFTAVRVAGTDPDGAIVSSYLRQLAEQAERLPPEAAARMAEIGLELVAAALAQRRAVEAPRQAVRSLQFEQAKAWLEHRLSDPALDSAAVAAALRVSPRYVQQLFQERGTTVADWVWERRLVRARAQLSDPRLSHLPIGLVAAACGFGDPAHFSRRFRERYGTSAREARRAALEGAAVAPGTVLPSEPRQPSLIP